MWITCATPLLLTCAFFGGGAWQAFLYGLRQPVKVPRQHVCHRHRSILPVQPTFERCKLPHTRGWCDGCSSLSVEATSPTQERPVITHNHILTARKPTLGTMGRPQIIQSTRYLTAQSHQVGGDVIYAHYRDTSVEGASLVYAADPRHLPHIYRTRATGDRIPQLSKFVPWMFAASNTKHKKTGPRSIHETMTNVGMSTQHL